MAITAQGLINYAKSKIGTPYVYGAKMELLTQAKYDWLKKTYGSMVWDSDKSKIGKVCCDCSGLISAYTGIVQGSAQMKAAAIKCQPISTIKDAPLGAILWKNGHVGVYIGNGEYIAEDGSAYGCRQNKISNASFTHWLLMDYINYGDDEVVEQVKILVNGKEVTVERILKNNTAYFKSNDISKIIPVDVSWDNAKGMTSFKTK